MSEVIKSTRSEEDCSQLSKLKLTPWSALCSQPSLFLNHPSQSSSSPWLKTLVSHSISSSSQAPLAAFLSFFLVLLFLEANTFEGVRRSGKKGDKNRKRMSPSQKNGNTWARSNWKFYIKPSLTHLGLKDIPACRDVVGAIKGSLERTLVRFESVNSISGLRDQSERWDSHSPQEQQEATKPTKR